MPQHFWEEKTPYTNLKNKKIVANGELFTWGEGTATGNQGSINPSPTLCKPLKDANVYVSQVSCGTWQTGILSLRGDVYLLGAGLFEYISRFLFFFFSHRHLLQFFCERKCRQKKKYPVGQNENYSTPIKVDALSGYSIRMIGCGGRHTICVSGKCTRLSYFRTNLEPFFFVFFFRFVSQIRVNCFHGERIVSGNLVPAPEIQIPQPKSKFWQMWQTLGPEKIILWQSLTTDAESARIFSENCWKLKGAIIGSCRVRAN